MGTTRGHDEGGTGCWYLDDEPQLLQYELSTASIVKLTHWSDSADSVCQVIGVAVAVAHNSAAEIDSHTEENALRNRKDEVR